MVVAAGEPFGPGRMDRFDVASPEAQRSRVVASKGVNDLGDGAQDGSDCVCRARPQRHKQHRDEHK
ncbi:hypothetical protein [Candidatus Protofrankia californiensis]|uniref:hypothetical protein n=1 Tax=Candidatus Protofrankia californiensis TaxID=1839754 RepID=UPI001040F441|nr:hypothetical protein [Candidatus Protofrankia californiensis]